MAISNPVKALGGLGGLAALKVAAAAANKKYQEENIKAGKPQGAFSEALFGKYANRLNEGMAGRRPYTGTSADQVEQFQNFTPEQRSIMNNLANIGQEGIQDVINRESGGFEPIAEQARESFHRETVPTIAERFSSLGSAGSQRSSAFGKQLGSAASDLETNLAALRSQYGLEKQNLDQNLYNNLLTHGLRPQYENAFLGGDVNSGPGKGALDSLNPTYQEILGLLNSFGEGNKGGALGALGDLAAPVAVGAAAGLGSAAAPAAGTVAGVAAADTGFKSWLASNAIPLALVGGLEAGNIYNIYKKYKKTSANKKSSQLYQKQLQQEIQKEFKKSQNAQLTPAQLKYQNLVSNVLAHPKDVNIQNKFKNFQSQVPAEFRQNIQEWLRDPNNPYNLENNNQSSVQPNENNEVPLNQQAEELLQSPEDRAHEEEQIKNFLNNGANKTRLERIVDNIKNIGSFIDPSPAIAGLQAGLSPYFNTGLSSYFNHRGLEPEVPPAPIAQAPKGKSRKKQVSKTKSDQRKRQKHLAKYGNYD